MTDSKFSEESAAELSLSSALTASSLTLFDDFSTVGMISDHAAHWNIEPFVPIDEADVMEMLRHRPESSGESTPRWDRMLRAIDDHLDVWSGTRSRRIMAAYRDCDPDRRHDLFETQSDESDESRIAVEQHTDRVAEEIRLLATAAGYTEVPRDQIEQCVGIASHWGVPLHIDFDGFKRLDVYARGDVIGYRARRNFRSLYRRRIVEVPVYQKMLVAFEMKGDAKYVEPSPDDHALPKGRDQMSVGRHKMHLRLFKNIPKQDVDMLLPTARVKLTGVDRLKIVLPSLGGFLMSLRKIAQFTLLLAALALHWIAILVAICVGYIVKSTLSYFQTRNRYQLNLTKNLYFQKLAAGEVVLTALVSQATAQRRVEAMLAFHGLLHAEEPISTRRLKRRCQRYVREGLDLEIDFRVDRALTLLVDAGLVTREGDGWRLTDRI